MSTAMSLLSHFPIERWPSLVLLSLFLAALTMAASALVTPLLRSAFPVEYLILGGWAGLGALTLVLRRKAYDGTGPRSQEP